MGHALIGEFRHLPHAHLEMGAQRGCIVLADEQDSFLLRQLFSFGEPRTSILGAGFAGTISPSRGLQRSKIFAPGKIPLTQADARWARQRGGRHSAANIVAHFPAIGVGGRPMAGERTLTGAGRRSGQRGSYSKQ